MRAQFSFDTPSGDSAPTTASLLKRSAGSLASATVALLFAMMPIQVSAQAMTATDAFAQGSAAASTSSTFAGVSDTTAADTLSGYSVAPPTQAGLFGNGYGDTTTPGSSKKANCITGPATGDAATDEECNAIKVLNNQPSITPALGITRNDPVLQAGKATTNDPESLATNFGSTYTGCSTSSTTIPGNTTYEICNDYLSYGDQMCYINRLVTVDVDRVYDCIKQDLSTSTQTCHRNLVVTAVVVPGCTPGVKITRVTANPCGGCIDYIAWDYVCQDGYYQQHLFTILKSNGATYQDLGWANVSGTPGAAIPQTQSISNMGGGYCFRTYYSQSCDTVNCTITSWFSNPCQGTSYAGATQFALPTKVSFQDSWDNQCTGLEAMAK